MNSFVMKKWMPILMAFTMLLSGIVPTISTSGNFGVTQGVAVADSITPTVNIGDYIQFGKYNDAPILWRVIHKESDGNVILFADRILTIKVFDAGGSYHVGNSDRVYFGSNFYKDSNIRQWLNSSSPNSGASTIDWIQNDPSAANIQDGHNPYNTEKGFLADGNFTATERALIKPYTHKVVLSGTDAAKKDGGTANHTSNKNIDSVVQNYDTDAYYQNVTDSIFMLSVKQIKEWVYDNSAALGTNYHIAKPTAEAVTQSTYKDAKLKSESYWYYWLNSPIASNDDFVRYVGTGGSVGEADPNYYDIGVRPALQLNLSSTIIKSGSGTDGSPYVVDVAPTNQAPTVNIGDYIQFGKYNDAPFYGVSFTRMRTAIQCCSPTEF